MASGAFNSAGSGRNLADFLRWIRSVLLGLIVPWLVAAILAYSLYVASASVYYGLRGSPHERLTVPLQHVVVVVWFLAVAGACYAHGCVVRRWARFSGRWWVAIPVVLGPGSIAGWFWFMFSNDGMYGSPYDQLLTGLLLSFNLLVLAGAVRGQARR